MKWIPFDGRTNLPPVNTPVLAWWDFSGERPTIRAHPPETPFAVAVYNGHLWHNPDDDEDDYRDPSHWMLLEQPSAALMHTQEKP